MLLGRRINKFQLLATIFAVKQFAEAIACFNRNAPKNTQIQNKLIIH